MAVEASDEQVAAIRAFLNHDLEENRRRHDLLRQTGQWQGYGELLTAAFLIMVRRHFSPTWSRADVILYIADLRGRIPHHEDDIEPRTAEVLILHALGQPFKGPLGELLRTRAEIYLLDEMVQDARLQRTAIDDLLEQARVLAPNVLSD